MTKWHGPLPLQAKGGKLKDFKAFCADDDIPELAKLKEDVRAFSSQFPMPGI